jgi:adenine deaminase
VSEFHINPDAAAARKLEQKQRLIRVASGREPAQLVLKNATYLNVLSNEYLKGDIAISDGRIAGIGAYEGIEQIDVSEGVVCPGLIDAHIHLESSLVCPAEFARAVVRHGTTTVIADPHEITNVMGEDGLRYMMQATENLPLDVYFMLPSCVPATPLDEAGGELNADPIDPWYAHPRVLGLGEMMNYVGVVTGQPDVLQKILGSQSHHKKIDGHAPGLSGRDLCAYIAAGVYSDHECDTFENALEKLRLGQFIMIRQGTAAKNLRALLPLLNRQYGARCMFATDDKHPNDLLYHGHIDDIAREAVECGVDPVLAVKAASYHAARYFLLNDKGAIAPGYWADLVVFDNLKHFSVRQVFKKGMLVFDGKEVFCPKPMVSGALAEKARHTMRAAPVAARDFACGRKSVIGLIPGELISENAGTAQGIDLSADILKIALVERHRATGHIGLGYLKGYGLKTGAVASSIAHDSHNIIAVGTSDETLAIAVNAVIDQQGGIAVVDASGVLAALPLPIAGLMSDESLETVNALLSAAKAAALRLGVPAQIDPFMTLSFMSLPVIPDLKLTTRGVFDVKRWRFADES